MKKENEILDKSKFILKNMKQLIYFIFFWGGGEKNTLLKKNMFIYNKLIKRSILLYVFYCIFTFNIFIFIFIFIYYYYFFCNLIILRWNKKSKISNNKKSKIRNNRKPKIKNNKSLLQQFLQLVKQINQTFKKANQ